MSLVIPTADRKNYLNVLGLCDKITGKQPYNGANAEIKQIITFVNYIANYVEKKLVFTEQIITGKIREIEETGKKQQNVTVNVTVNEGKNVTVKDNIIDMVRQKPNITVSEMANILSVEKRTIYRNLEKLKSSGLLVRVGADKNGYWKITHK